MEHFLVNILMIDAQDSMLGGTINREVVHTVMVRAHLLQLLHTGVQPVIAISRIGPQNGRTPWNQRRPLVTCRQCDRIRARGWDCIKAQARC